MSLDLNYIRRCFLTFCPKWFFKLSPFRFTQRKHWKRQDRGTQHGYDQYDHDKGIRDDVFVLEILARVSFDKGILDLGCNCGRDLSLLKGKGYKKLTGVDICANAIEYG